MLPSNGKQELRTYCRDADRTHDLIRAVEILSTAGDCINIDHSLDGAMLLITEQLPQNHTGPYCVCGSVHGSERHFHMGNLHDMADMRTQIETKSQITRVMGVVEPARSGVYVFHEPPRSTLSFWINPNPGSPAVITPLLPHHHHQQHQRQHISSLTMTNNVGFLTERLTGMVPLPRP